MNYMKNPLYYKKYLESLAQIPVDAENLNILMSAKEYKKEILSLIKKATRRIYIVALYLQNDAAGKEILEELYKAKQESPGIEIKVFVDFHRAQRALIGEEAHSGNVGMYQSMSRKYEHQIELLGVPVKSRELFGVLHLKGSVFDDMVFYTGASLNNVYLHHEDRFRCDRYHMLENRKLADIMVDYLVSNLENSPAVQPLYGDKILGVSDIKVSIRKLKKELNHAKYHFTHKTPGENQIGITPLTGFGRKNNSLNSTILNLMRSTASELTLLTPYFNLPYVLLKEVKKLLKRGVIVNVITGDKIANDFYISPEESFNKIGTLPYIYEINLKRFAKKFKKAIGSGYLNIYVWSLGSHSFHLKGIYSDNSYKIITGNNLNPRAWTLDLENGLLIHDKKNILQNVIKEEMDVILENTKRIDSWEELDKISDYPVRVRKILSRVRRSKMDLLIKKML